MSTALTLALPNNNLRGVIRAHYATTAALPACTYANGTLGVGATLTGNANGALSAQDGVTPAAADVIFVKDQATGAQNGVYVVTTLGDGSNPFVLTRIPAADTAAKISGAVIEVITGTLYQGSLWRLNVRASAITVGTTALSWSNEILLRNRPATFVRMMEDWFAGTVAGDHGWVASVSGTAAAVSIAATGADTTHWGVITLSTGSTTTGRATQLLTNGTAKVGGSFVFDTGGQIVCEWLVQVPLLDDGVDTFNVRVGLADTFGAGDMANGIYFEYDKSVNTHWGYVTAAGSVRTRAASTVTVTAAQWYRLRIWKAEGSTTWNFEIDGVAIASVSTNVPTLAVAPLVKIEKLVTGGGATARTVLADWCLFEASFLTPRG